jgi:hypothetical protein
MQIYAAFSSFRYSATYNKNANFSIFGSLINLNRILDDISVVLVKVICM